MLDTIKIYTDDFAIKDNAEIELLPSTINYRTGETTKHKLFMNENHKWIEGAKAYLNTDNFNLTIKPMPTSGEVYLWLQLSVPKFMTGDNFYPLDEKRSQGLPSELERELGSRGIGLSISDCKVSRIDTFKNVYADESFEDYSKIFRLLRAKRQNRRDYGSTFLWHNNYREICVYDKITEVQNRGHSIEGLPENTIRFEYRLLKSRSVKDALGFNEVDHLVENLDSIRDVYNQALEYHLFGLEINEFETLVSSQWTAIIDWYINNKGRNWMSRLLQDYGAWSINKSLSSGRFREIVENKSGYRKAGYRIEKKLNDAGARIELMTEAKGSKTSVDLYQELKQKVLENAKI